MAELTSLAYPRHVHLPSHFGEWRSRVVVDANACADALAEGYSLDPVIVPDGESLDGEPVNPAASASASDAGESASDAPAGDAPPRNKGGRPRKADTDPAKPKAERKPRAAKVAKATEADA